MSDQKTKRETQRTEREAIRDELEAGGRGELAKVALALENQGVDEEVPPMPESLEAKVRERYGAGREEPAAREVEVGLVAAIRGFFAKPLLAGGMLAAAACVVLAVAMLNGPNGSSVVRGGGGSTGGGALVIVIGEEAVEGIAGDALRKVKTEEEGVSVLEKEVGRMRIVVIAVEKVVAGYGAGESDAGFELEYGGGESLLDVIAEAEERLRAAE